MTMNNQIFNSTSREIAEVIQESLPVELTGQRLTAAKQGTKAFVEPITILHEGGAKGVFAQMAAYHLLQAQTFFNRSVEVEWNGGKNR
jgi:hypothetical protein